MWSRTQAPQDCGPLDGCFDVVIVDIPLENTMGTTSSRYCATALQLPMAAVPGLMPLDLDVQMTKLSNMACCASQPLRPRELICAIGCAWRAMPKARRASTGALDRVAVK